MKPVLFDDWAASVGEHDELGNSLSTTRRVAESQERLHHFMETASRLLARNMVEALMIGGYGMPEKASVTLREHADLSTQLSVTWYAYCTRINLPIQYVEFAFKAWRVEYRRRLALEQRTKTVRGVLGLLMAVLRERLGLGRLRRG